MFRYLFILIFVLFFLAHLPIIILELTIYSIVMLLGRVTKYEKLTKFGWNLLISVDQHANTITGGSPDETISSRTAKAKNSQLWAKYLSNFLDLFEKDHVEKSIEEDEGGDQVLDD
jgi:hypothetical protein